MKIESAKLFWGLTIAIYLLAIFNSCDTLSAINSGGFYEANPIASATINTFPVLLFLWPLVTTTAFYLIRRFCDRQVGNIGMMIMFGFVIFVAVEQILVKL